MAKETKLIKWAEICVDDKTIKFWCDVPTKKFYIQEKNKKVEYDFKVNNMLINTINVCDSIRYLEETELYYLLSNKCINEKDNCQKLNYHGIRKLLDFISMYFKWEFELYEDFLKRK